VAEGEPITAKMVTKRAIESAQKQSRSATSRRRKNVLKYDDIMSGQRDVIYDERTKILEGRDLRDEALEMVSESVSEVANQYVSPDVFPEDWDVED
jgi:preprotein translocase subunit SecA